MSVHDSIHVIIILSFGTLFIHIRPWMAAQQSAYCQLTLFLSKFALFALHLRELSQWSNISCIRTALCTMKKLGRRQFWHALQNDCWAAIPDPLWTTNVPYERKINMLSSTDNNFMIFFLLDFEKFRIECLFLFFSFLLTLYMGIDFLSSFNASRPFLHVVSEKDKNCELFLGTKVTTSNPRVSLGLFEG